jgi:hypothetical protein
MSSEAKETTHQAVDAPADNVDGRVCSRPAQLVMNSASLDRHPSEEDYEETDRDGLEDMHENSPYTHARAPFLRLTAR